MELKSADWAMDETRRCPTGGGFMQDAIWFLIWHLSFA